MALELTRTSPRFHYANVMSKTYTFILIVNNVAEVPQRQRCCSSRPIVCIRLWDYISLHIRLHAFDSFMKYIKHKYISNHTLI